MQRDAGKKTIGYAELIRNNPNFRNLWTGQVISLLGDWFDLIASASLISYLTRSGLAVGSLFVIRMLAPFLVSPLAGVLADRFNRKRLLIVADILRGIVVLGFLFVRNSGTSLAVIRDHRHPIGLQRNLLSGAQRHPA